MATDATPRRLLLLGGSGQVGHELTLVLPHLGKVIALDRAAADLAAPESLRAILTAHRPHAVVIAAGYTAVDRAEREPELARLVNAVAPGVVAEEARALGACVVYYSTDYVFDGRKNTPYEEGDAANPLSVYGRTKLAGETAVASACARHVILRTSWVYSARGSNFLKTILGLAAERDSLRVVADQVGAPTSAALVAEVTTHVLEAMLSATTDDSRWGSYHVAAAGETTWHGYARHLLAAARRLGMRLKATPESVIAIASRDYPLAAARPANSRLNTARLRASFDVQLPEWTRDVERVLEQLKAS